MKKSNTYCVIISVYEAPDIKSQWPLRDWIVPEHMTDALCSWLCSNLRVLCFDEIGIERVIFELIILFWCLLLMVAFQHWYIIIFEDLFYLYTLLLIYIFK